MTATIIRITAPCAFCQGAGCRVIRDPLRAFARPRVTGCKPCRETGHVIVPPKVERTQETA